MQSLTHFFAYAVLTASLVALPAATAHALPRSMVEITYFQDATFAQQVGFEVRPTCNGSPSPLQGRRTRFAVRVADACNTGAHHSREIACFLDGRLTTCPANICDSHLVHCS